MLAISLNMLLKIGSLNKIRTGLSQSCSTLSNYNSHVMYHSIITLQCSHKVGACFAIEQLIKTNNKILVTTVL